jgi:hypothetical protein
MQRAGAHSQDTGALIVRCWDTPFGPLAQLSCATEPNMREGK